MLSPGSATALVNPALEWLQPDHIRSLKATLSKCQHPEQARAGRHQGRADPGAVPGAMCSALAAVLQFLVAHIQARQVSTI